MKNKKLYFELRMKLMKNLRTFTFFMLAGAIAFTTSSCSDDDDSTKSDYGTVTGMVTDENNTSISGVAVTISDVEGSTATGADGKYSFSNVPMDKRTITFTKKNYLTTSATVLAGKFDANKVASISIQMLSAAAKVMGTVTDAKNNNAPLAGVTVKLGSLTTTTDNDGTYLFESLIIDDYSITFSKTGYVAVSRDIKKAQFIDKIATLDIRLGGVEVLPGLTADDLKEADKWLYKTTKENYHQICNEFHEMYGLLSIHKEEWKNIGEQLLIFFVYTYFCGAVYDDMVCSKMELALFSARWIQEFLIVRWLENGKKLFMKDVEEISWRYAREVEHSDENLNTLEDWLFEKYAPKGCINTDGCDIL